MEEVKWGEKENDKMVNSEEESNKEENGKA
jgi:hypothetical protein